MEAARRRYETANMKACVVPLVSRNGDVRAAFRADQSPDDEPKVCSHIIHGHVVADTPPLSTNPALSNEDERDRTYAEGFAVSSDEQIQPLASNAISTKIAVEPESPPNSQGQPVTQYRYLHRHNRDSGSSYVPSIHMTRNGVYQHKHRVRSLQSDSDTDFDKRRAPKRLDCKYVALGQRNKERFDLSDCDTDVETTPALKRRKRKDASPGHNDDPLFPLSDADTDSDTTPAPIHTTQGSDKQESQYAAPEHSDKPRCTQCGSTIDIEITHVLVNATQVPISTTEAPEEEEESSINDRPPMKQRCIDLAKSSLCMQGWNSRKGAFSDAVSGLPGLRHARSWCAERAQIRIERGVVRVVKQ
jgi:hypothetical protein